MIAYRAMLDAPRELVRYLATLLAAERRARGTHRGTRALTCFCQPLLVLVWFRKGEDKTVLGAGFGVVAGHRVPYVAEGVKVLDARAPDLHAALRRVADDGWSHVILDGKRFITDRLAETPTSVKGATIDAWYSGKHRDFGANIQVIMRPDGLPIWTSDATPGGCTISPRRTARHRCPVLGRVTTGPTDARRLRLRRRQPGHPHPDQATR